MFRLIKKVIQYIYYGLIDFIFNFLCFISKSENKPVENNILIIISDGLGDNIVRIELIKKYIDFFNTQKLTFLTEQTSGVDELLNLVVDKRLNYLYFSGSQWLNNPLYRFKKIRNLYNYNFSDILILFTIENRASKPFIHTFKTNKTTYLHTDDITRYSLLDDISLYNKVTANDISLVEATTTNLIKIISSVPLPTLNLPNKYIVIGVGASLYGRRYPIDSLITIVEWLISKNYKIVFLGKGNTDLVYINTLFKRSRLIKYNSLNFISKLSFIDSLQVLKSAQLFIGVESGLFNAANFLNVPLVVIYGGGHYGRFKHTRESAIYVSHKMPCFGCNWSNCPHGSLKHKSAKCISSIKPDAVIEGVNTLLN